MLLLRSLPSSLLLLVSPHISIVTAATDYTIASFDSTLDPGLTSACNAVYTQAIPSCQPSDFSAINPCSATCLQSLQTLQNAAQSACMNQNMPAQSMLAYFRDGTGVLELCPTLKQVATTMSTSKIPSATTVPPAASLATATGTPSASVQAKPSGAEGEQSTGILALNKPVLIAVIAGITVALAIIIIIAAMMFRKHYR
ncbi:PQ loop repeat protein [Venturia nashicola]|uniref:PQ loop repeat protein n=1 Tax=Venturia nashicola TaxID=86259 RepID=A0A4Z1P771_9PEZI|nr:PQ loop repeat protein [Venturia nashicola]